MCFEFLFYHQKKNQKTAWNTVPRLQYQHSKTVLTSLWLWSLQAKHEQKTRIYQTQTEKNYRTEKNFSNT